MGNEINSLYVVGLPIGNWQQVSFEAINCLQKGAVVIVESKKAYHRFLATVNKNAAMFFCDVFSVNRNCDQETREKIKHFKANDKSTDKANNQESIIEITNNNLNVKNKEKWKPDKDLVFRHSRIFGPYHFDMTVELSEHDSISQISTLLKDLKKKHFSKVFPPWQLEKYQHELLVRYQKGYICLVSDAGLSYIADPGSQVIAVAGSMNWQINVLSGPSSILMALGYLAQPWDGFEFVGFPARDNALRVQQLKKWAKMAKCNRPIVFLETPYRMKKLLSEMSQYYTKNFRVLLAIELGQSQQKIWQGMTQDLIELQQKLPSAFNCVIVLLGEANVP